MMKRKVRIQSVLSVSLVIIGFISMLIVAQDPEATGIIPVLIFLFGIIWFFGSRIGGWWNPE